MKRLIRSRAAGGSRSSARALAGPRRSGDSRDRRRARCRAGSAASAAATRDASSARSAISSSDERRAAGQLLDRAAVEIAGREIHRGEGACRAQPLIDQADALEQLRPVDVGDQPHAGDDVAHGDVGRALPLLRVLHHLIDRSALQPEPLLQPAERGRRSRILVSQPLCELRGEDARTAARTSAWGCPSSSADRASPGREKPVGQRVGIARARAARR